METLTIVITVAAIAIGLVALVTAIRNRRNGA